VAAAVECVIQGCRGLEHAHAAGVIHRDVKPSNFLLDTAGVVKVLDLGLSRLEDVEDPAGQRQPGTYILGSCDYLAPEQSADPAAAGPRADIYGLGATLFFLLNRQAMYTNGSAFDRVMAHRTAPTPSLRELRPEVSPALEAVYRRMVAKDLAERFPSMDQVRAALEVVAAADPATAAVRAGGLAALATGGEPANLGPDTTPSGVKPTSTGDPPPPRLGIQARILAVVVVVVLGLLAWAVLVARHGPTG
jgi:serine/threonine protein kinase